MESFGHKMFISSQPVPLTGTGVLYPRLRDFSKNVLCNISTISKPILVKFWIINLMTKPNKPYYTTPLLDPSI